MPDPQPEPAGTPTPSGTPASDADADAKFQQWKQDVERQLDEIVDDSLRRKG